MPKKKEKGIDLWMWIAVIGVIILILKGLGLLKLWFNIDPDGVTFNIDVGFLTSSALFIYVLTRMHKLNDIMSKQSETLVELRTKIDYIEKKIEKIK